MSALCSIFFWALILSCCLISPALCRQFQASDLGCFIDHMNGVRDVNELKYLGMSRVGSNRVVHHLNSTDAGFIFSKGMTHELCGSVCALGGFQFMALQAGYYCTCGNSYGRQGAAPDADCAYACGANAYQNCGGDYRNRIFHLRYASSGPGGTCMSTNQNLFVPGNRTFVQISVPDVPAFRTFVVPGLLDCVIQCRAGCEAVIFSQKQRLCHLLEYAVVPAALSSASSGDFFVRG